MRARIQAGLTVALVSLTLGGVIFGTILAIIKHQRGFLYGLAILVFSALGVITTGSAAIGGGLAVALYGHPRRRQMLSAMAGALALHLFVFACFYLLPPAPSQTVSILIFIPLSLLFALLGGALAKRVS